MDGFSSRRVISEYFHGEGRGTKALTALVSAVLLLSVRVELVLRIHVQAVDCAVSCDVLRMH